VPLCPEVLGGRPVPRVPCEIKGGSGADVLDGRAKVYEKTGADVTEEMKEGAALTAAAALRMGIKTAVLKSKSPSCGCGRIYDGTFSGRLIDGNGTAAEALIRAGIKVYNEENFAHMSQEK